MFIAKEWYKLSSEHLHTLSHRLQTPILGGIHFQLTDKSTENFNLHVCGSVPPELSTFRFPCNIALWPACVTHFNRFQTEFWKHQTMTCPTYCDQGSFWMMLKPEAPYHQTAGTWLGPPGSILKGKPGLQLSIYQ